jgi:hypothetical protein
MGPGVALSGVVAAGSARQSPGAARATARAGKVVSHGFSVSRAAPRRSATGRPARRAGPLSLRRTHSRADGLFPDLRTSDGGGRSPGSRVTGPKPTPSRFPSGAGACEQTPNGQRTLAAYSCGNSCGFGASPAPHSLLAAVSGGPPCWGYRANLAMPQAFRARRTRFRASPARRTASGRSRSRSVRPAAPR